MYTEVIDEYPNEFYIFERHGNKLKPIYLIKFDNVINYNCFNVYEINGWFDDTNEILLENLDIVCKSHFKAIDDRLFMDFEEGGPLYLYVKNGVNNFKLLLDYLYLIGHQNRNEHVKKLIDEQNINDTFFEYKNAIN